MRSAEWFIKRIYRPMHFYISGFALVRREDFVSAMEYFFKNYYRNPSKAVLGSEELKDLFRRAFGIDTVLFSEVLTRHKNFVFDNSLNYIKITHSSNQIIALKEDSLSEIFKWAYYYLLIHKYIYETKWPKFYRGMKIFSGAQALSTAFIGFVKSGFRPSFLNIEESKEFIYKFFGEFSLIEMAMVVMYLVPMSLSRCFDFTKRKFAGNSGKNIEESSIFTPRNFLDPEGRFRAD